MHAAALKTDNQQGPTMQHRARCSASRGGPGGRGWGGAHSVSVWLSPFLFA